MSVIGDRMVTADDASPAPGMAADPKLMVQDLDLFYGDFHALTRVQMSILPHQITALIGPSGCGKSTLLRCFNRMNDLIDSVRLSGRILLDRQDIRDPALPVVTLRKRVGMVFQRPNPFPLSVFENVAFGVRIHTRATKPQIYHIVEQSLQAVGLWEALKDRLHGSALRLSLEQQQRLCIARLVAVEPEVLLMDEPCSALDPIATGEVEELMRILKTHYTVVIVTHNMQQAARVSDVTGFMLVGELVECGPTNRLFTNPKDPRTEAYITGRFG